MHLACCGAEELALPTHRLDERDACFGERGGEHETREPGARAEIRDRLRLAQLGHLEPGERVGEVDPDDLVWVVHGGRRSRLGEEIEKHS